MYHVPPYFGGNLIFNEETLFVFGVRRHPCPMLLGQLTPGAYASATVTLIYHL